MEREGPRGRLLTNFLGMLFDRNWLHELVASHFITCSYVLVYGSCSSSMFHVHVLDFVPWFSCCFGRFPGLRSSSTSHLDSDPKPTIYRESAFYLYEVKVESRFSRNRSSRGVAALKTQCSSRRTRSFHPRGV